MFVPFTDFTRYSSSSLVVQQNRRTHFRVYLDPQTIVPAAGRLVFYLPTKNAYNQ